MMAYKTLNIILKTIKIPATHTTPVAATRSHLSPFFICFQLGDRAKKR
jgi:hypothetical protein